MRAWQTTQAGRPRDVLALNPAAPSPTPREGTVRLHVLSAGIGLPDALMCLSNYPLTPTLPFTQGQEVCGRVLDWGHDVRGRRTGDRVMAVTSFFTGDGSFAEECLALDDFCLPVPDGMSDAEAACFLIPFHTAYIALVARAKLEPGETLLVLAGASGTGVAAIQVGRALGARVIASVGHPAKAALCRALGAETVLDHHAPDFPKQVLDATGGRGANAIFDPVGGDLFTKATQCIAQEGRLLAIGFASGRWGTVDMPHLVQRNYSVVGVIPSGYDRAYKERAQERMLGWWREGRLRIPVDEVVPFDALPDALERLADSRVQGKLALTVDAESAHDGR
ncbi:MAG: NADPH:quinone oxidoreductase family protein [Myxococcota bacterium]